MRGTSSSARLLMRWLASDSASPPDRPGFMSEMRVVPAGIMPISVAFGGWTLATTSAPPPPNAAAASGTILAPAASKASSRKPAASPAPRCTRISTLSCLVSLPMLSGASATRCSCGAVSVGTLIFMKLRLSAWRQSRPYARRRGSADGLEPIPAERERKSGIRHESGGEFLTMIRRSSERCILQSVPKFGTNSRPENPVHTVILDSPSDRLTSKILVPRLWLAALLAPALSLGLLGCSGPRATPAQGATVPAPMPAPLPANVAPPTFIKTTSDARITRLIDVREGMNKAALFRAASDFLTAKYSVDVSDSRAGFVMTPWQASFNRGGAPDLHYRTRIIIRFIGDDWKQVSVRAEANWQRDDEWDIGYDTQILEDVVVELRTRIGKRS